MTTPNWEALCPPGVPRSLAPYPERTLLDFLRDSARERPDASALLFKGAISYGELEGLAAAAARALHALGVRKRDRVALLLPNSPQSIVAVFGAWGAGAIVVPLNPLYTARELEPLVREVGCETAVVFTPFYDKVKAIRAQTGLRRVVVTGLEAMTPFGMSAAPPPGLQAGDTWLPELLARHAGDPAPAARVGPDDEALVLFTGGTTGPPKGVVGSHRCLVAAGLQFAACLGANGFAPWTEVMMLNVPLFHVMGMAGMLPLWCVSHSAACPVPNPRDLEDLLAIMRAVRPTLLFGVPTLYVGLFHHPAVKAGQAGLDRLKHCLAGGAPLLVETKQRFEELTGARILEGYSLTEAMMACVVTPPQRGKPGSVGIPFPDVDVRVVDSAGSDLPAGEIGEILLRGPQIMLGYWGRPEETAQVLRDGWLRTGDLGYLDAEGYLFIADRLKDLVKVSGFQVWPREVEEVLAAHPAVAEVAVAGVPDAYQGEAVKAWIVLRAGQQASADELCAHCRERLAPYKVPKHVEFRGELPKSLIGKVLRRELRSAEGRHEEVAARAG